MIRDLRDWIDRLRDAGELVEVTAPVDPYLEITEITDRVSKRGGPALLFHNVIGSEFPVLINQFGSDARMCMSLEVDSLDIPGQRIQELMDLQPPHGLVAKVKALGKLRELASFSPRMVKTAPCQEVWMNNPDLLAEGRRAVHHPPVGVQQGPRDRGPQLRDVPRPGC